MRRLVSLLCTVTSLALAQSAPPEIPASAPAPNPSVDPAKTPVEQLDAFRYRIGEVTLDQRSREIRFPAQVNMSQGLLEYLVVLAKGKVHEALLVTSISPTHLNLAFTLLRYPASHELFALKDASGRRPNKLPAVPAAVKSAARIAIEVEWNDHDQTRRLPVNEWIQHIVTTTAMKPGPWLYTGSDFRQGKFIPELTGDLGAIMIDPGALTNYPGPDNGDNVWFAFPKRVPPEATPVTVIITPWSKTPPLPKP